MCSSQKESRFRVGELVEFDLVYTTFRGAVIYKTFVLDEHVKSWMNGETYCIDSKFIKYFEEFYLIPNTWYYLIFCNYKKKFVVLTENNIDQSLYR